MFAMMIPIDVDVILVTQQPVMSPHKIIREIALLGGRDRREDCGRRTHLFGHNVLCLGLGLPQLFSYVVMTGGRELSSFYVTER